MGTIYDAPVEELETVLGEPPGRDLTAAMRLIEIIDRATAGGLGISKWDDIEAGVILALIQSVTPQGFLTKVADRMRTLAQWHVVNDDTVDLQRLLNDESLFDWLREDGNVEYAVLALRALRVTRREPTHQERPALDQGALL